MGDNNSEVRLNVAKNLSKLSKVVGKDLLDDKMLQKLDELTKDA